MSPKPESDFDPANWVDRALEGGMSFGIDQDGAVGRWEAVLEIDPGPSETCRQLRQELDENRQIIREEIRRRAEHKGVFMEMGDMQDPDNVYGYVLLCGTPCLGPD